MGYRVTATLEQVIDAVADQLRDVLTDELQDLHVEAGFFRSAELPAINVYPGPPGAVQTTEFAGFGQLYGAWPLLIRAVVSPADLEAGESLLWALMDDVGDLSIIAALDSDETLGGVSDTIGWGEWSEARDFSPADQDGVFVGAVLPIVVAKAYS